MSLAEQLASLPPAEFDKFLASLTDFEADKLVHDWELYAREDQMLPPEDAIPGGWFVWLILAGRGFGKTRTGVEAVKEWAKHNQFVNLAGATSDDVRDIMIEGESGILAHCSKAERPWYRPSKRRLDWPNGARSLLFTGEEPDRARGKQSEKLWCFIGGTQILTPTGQRSVESLTVGDLVVTRGGWRRVTETDSRIAPVGEVKFSNGAKLVGTGEHPVLTSSGWTRLDQLSTGQCARMAISAHTSARRDHMGNVATSTCTVGCGSRRTAQSRTAGISTIATGISSTTLWRIWNAFRFPNIASFIRLSLDKGRTVSASCCAALFAVGLWSEGGWTSLPNAAPATQSRLSDSASPSASVESAARRSVHGAATTAVSVASTWAPAGNQEVFNLTVEGEHEYFANGILTHNCDELASWKYSETWDQLMLGLRLGKNPQAVATTTPRPIPLIKALLASPTTVVTRGSTYANKANLSEKFISQIITKYLGTRLGRQEIDAEVLDENPNALWTLANIEANRIQKLPQLVRIVVAIDPAATSSEEADDTGIVVAGRDDQQPPHFYVFDDQTTHDKPAGWAKKAVTAYHEHEADRIVGEINNGGEMVEHTVRTVDENVSYKSVHATRGKAIRAEPVSALYEQNRVHHVGFWPKLEDEMVQFDPSLGPNQKSPNRMDALVWAITDLADTKDGIFGYYQDRSKEAAKAKPKENNVPLPKDVRKWSEPVRILQMGIQPEITKEQWPAFHVELTDWMEAFAKDKDRVKAGEKLIEKLEKKYGKVPVASE